MYEYATMMRIFPSHAENVSAITVG